MKLQHSCCMIIDSNATTCFVQQQIYETGKHTLSISWLIYLLKKRGWNSNMNVAFPKHTIQNVTLVNFLLYTVLLLHFSLKMDERCSENWILSSKLLCLHFTSLKLYTEYIFTSLSIAYIKFLGARYITHHT